MRPYMPLQHQCCQQQADVHKDIHVNIDKIIHTSFSMTSLTGGSSDYNREFPSATFAKPITCFSVAHTGARREGKWSGLMMTTQRLPV
eukprot:4370753-Amphidinium_carterae.1